MKLLQQLLIKHIDIWTAIDPSKKSGRGRTPVSAGSAYGISKLRDLILELAVHGKLVPQNEDDEPATELLKKIAIEKYKAAGTRTGSKQKLPPTLSQQDVPSYLPKSWACPRLADIVKILNGRAYKKEELLESGTPVLRVGNLFTSDHWYYSNLELEEEKYCNPGDLLFAWSASFGPFLWNGERAIFHYHIWKLDFFGKDLIYKRYLYMFLLEQTQKIKAAGHGVMMTHMTKEKMEKLVVFLPPLGEQRRIVAKVDELMALCDQLEAQHNDAVNAHDQLVSHLLNTLTACQNPADFNNSWRRISAHFDTLFTTDSSVERLKETLLQLAVSGKLVRQDPQDESGSQLLSRIRTEKAALVAKGKIKNDKNYSETVNEEILPPLPNGWIWTTLKSIAQINPRNSAEDDLAASFVPMSMISTQFNTSHEHELRTWKEIKQGFTHFAEGDIGVAKITPCFENSKACVFSGLQNRIGAGTTELHIVRPIPDTLCPRYVLAYLKSPNFLTLGEAEMVGTAGQKRLPKEFVELNPFPLPPLNEQQRIVKKLDDLMAICEQLKSSIVDATQCQQMLADALVANAV